MLGSGAMANWARRNSLQKYVNGTQDEKNWLHVKKTLSTLSSFNAHRNLRFKPVSRSSYLGFAKDLMKTTNDIHNVCLGMLKERVAINRDLGDYLTDSTTTELITSKCNAE